jgi:hypothetical protein
MAECWNRTEGTGQNGDQVPAWQQTPLGCAKGPALTIIRQIDISHI